MNKQGAGEISWTDYTWNPIKGLCPMGCWYCYARKIYRRFHINEKTRISFDELMAPRKKKKHLKIFVCSTYELFHPSVPKAVRKKMFEVIESCPQHTFQILTKMPENIDRPMPDNVWLGVSITGNTIADFMRAASFGLRPRKARVQFVSYEPILAEPVRNIPKIDWIILGRLTGHGHKWDPKREWLDKLIFNAGLDKTPIFLKNNLKEILGDDLIQQFPE